MEDKMKKILCIEDIYVIQESAQEAVWCYLSREEFLEHVMHRAEKGKTYLYNPKDLEEDEECGIYDADTKMEELLISQRDFKKFFKEI